MVSGLDVVADANTGPPANAKRILIVMSAVTGFLATIVHNSFVICDDSFQVEIQQERGIYHRLS